MSTRRPKRISYTAGDLFMIPSRDGRFYLGQIAVDARAEIGANFCYLFREKIQDIDGAKGIGMKEIDVISTMLVTPELVDFGTWKVCGHNEVLRHVALDDLTALRRNSFVGATIVGAGLVGDYLDTYFGLLDDSHWPDPSYVYKHFSTNRAKSAKRGRR